MILLFATACSSTAAASRATDIAIKVDRVVAVGAPGTLMGDYEIDVAGKLVAPGFVDVRTPDM